jgi:hypothetical protein
MSNAKVKLLIVDDDEPVRESLSQLFSEFGLVRRRFPGIRVIAMSGGFSVNDIPRLPPTLSTKKDPN